MNDRYSYSDLVDMARIFAADHEGIGLRTEVIREILETPEMNNSIHRARWSLLDDKHIRYYAENPDRIPASPKMFRTVLAAEAKNYGAYIVEFATR